ncbi:chitinase-3-like protein 1 [Drosophila ficusphila]|uniref:chitinase-3-like protein 1 n=1 Tax=Drosophila ficusphila TaxID=30025 RepID=UPI0007E86ECD|nr:chitinase-3-like protein 1 [Drosophila ficusphila]
MGSYEKLEDNARGRDIDELSVRGHRISGLQTIICWTVLLSLLLCLSIGFISLGLQGLQSQRSEPVDQRLVCYYASDGTQNLSLLDVPGDLCTHINIGPANLDNATIVLPDSLIQVLQNDSRSFRAAHPQVHLLLWIGGADSGRQFARMVVNHAMRKVFLQSLRQILRTYPSMDGIDLDWEFPSAYDRERMHLSQLLYEIRTEWRREKRTNNILSLAVAAPEGIALYAYDIRELNMYADYVNLMAYDFHFYRQDTPFTGLNAPLYARSQERSLMATFNINYTVQWWLKSGLEPHRLVVGLPTYGHSFTLVSPLNRRIGAPASGFGKCGQLGFTTLSETCECAAKYIEPTFAYDAETCSPYLSALQEWISYENQTSIVCKANYVKSLSLGGVMVFSLNTDDLKNSCSYLPNSKYNQKPVFPLTQAIREILRNSL